MNILHILGGLLIPFITGGLVVGGVKFLSTSVGPSYAAVLGSFPTGLLGSYFIMTRNETLNYSYHYIFMLLIVLIVAICYYLLLKYTNLSAHVAFAISFSLWIVLVVGRELIRYFYKK